jgi:hypothetical protein
VDWGGDEAEEEMRGGEEEAERLNSGCGCVTRVSRGEEKEGERRRPDLAGEGRTAGVARRSARAHAWELARRRSSARRRTRVACGPSA